MAARQNLRRFEGLIAPLVPQLCNVWKFVCQTVSLCYPTTGTLWTTALTVFERTHNPSNFRLPEMVGSLWASEPDKTITEGQDLGRL